MDGKLPEEYRIALAMSLQADLVNNVPITPLLSGR
jgi:hypothetical protein